MHLWCVATRDHQDHEEYFLIQVLAGCNEEYLSIQLLAGCTECRGGWVGWWMQERKHSSLDPRETPSSAHDNKAVAILSLSHLTIHTNSLSNVAF
jgi:hypothetical protein